MRKTCRYGLLYHDLLYPHVPVILSHKGCRIIVQALIDTGATHSLIDGEIAGLLNHDLRNRKVIREDINTAGNAIKGYHHSFRVQILESADDEAVVWDSGEELLLRCSRTTSKFSLIVNNLLFREKNYATDTILGWDILRYMQFSFHPREQYFEIEV